MFEKRANEAYDVLSQVDGIYVNQPQGAFYMAILFDDGVLNSHQGLPITNSKAKEFVETHLADLEPDKRFVYYLLAATGICVVPLTGFCCSRKGFRVTLLECDDAKRQWTWKTIAESIKQYLASG